MSATREYERLYKIDSFRVSDSVRVPDEILVRTSNNIPIPNNIPVRIPIPNNIPFPDIFSPPLPKPYEIPSYRFHFLLDPVTGSFTPVIAHKALHVLKPAPRGVKEGKNRSKVLASYRMFSKFNQLFFGKYQEFDEIVKRFYDALPAKLTRFKGRDGKWRRKTINPLEMIDVVVANFDQVDLVSVAGNWFKDEITDRYIGFWGNVSRNAAIRLGSPRGYDTLSAFVKKTQDDSLLIPFKKEDKPLGYPDKSISPFSSENASRGLDGLVNEYMNYDDPDQRYRRGVAGLPAYFANYVALKVADTRFDNILRSMIYDEAKVTQRDKYGHVVVQKGDFIVSNKKIIDSAYKKFGFLGDVFKEASYSMMQHSDSSFDEEAVTTHRRNIKSSYRVPHEKSGHHFMVEFVEK
ncbi:hypothetical protein C0030_003500 [Candidatus Liberibacter solanacearum]|uniref:Uncharacterized protein n=1 Tax=Candidatus Liberibacter solanacearum TaxID=556287 RepID=A0A424FM78_9HYPH|nr:hypothetical protein [Candidatus Liberibacter solanacearum]RPD37235.1 hypothetical protein C0030_003500 [Candidatus Liberibacter solanacearum]